MDDKQIIQSTKQKKEYVVCLTKSSNRLEIVGMQTEGFQACLDRCQSRQFLPRNYFSEGGSWQAFRKRYCCLLSVFSFSSERNFEWEYKAATPDQVFGPWLQWLHAVFGGSLPCKARQVVYFSLCGDTTAAVCINTASRQPFKCALMAGRLCGFCIM